MTVKMPKIGGFHNIIKTAEMTQRKHGEVTWVSKVKIHGTNAGIRIDSDGTVTAQKRSEDITVGDDNFGFAQYVEACKKVFDFQQIFRLYHEAISVTIMGEWAGPGIQKGVAVSQIPAKHFFPFAIAVDHADENSRIRIIHYHGTELEYLKELPNCIVLPVYGIHSVDMDDRHAVKDLIDEINSHVVDIEKCDPVIKHFFNVEGIGEGLVFYPVNKNVDVLEIDGWCTSSELETLGFKVKGEEHAVNKAGKPARLKSEIPEDAFQFVDQHVTEARLRQGLENIPSNAIKHTGDFIGWVCRDVAIESAQEIQESGFDWKTTLSPIVAKKARVWFHRQLEDI